MFFLVHITFSFPLKIFKKIDLVCYQRGTRGLAGKKGSKLRSLKPLAQHVHTGTCQPASTVTAHKLNSQIWAMTIPISPFKNPR